MLNGFRILCVNELRSILREKVALFWIFFFPFFFLAIMLLSYGQESLFGRQRIEVVDNDRTTISRKYIDKVRDTFASSPVLLGDIVVLDGAPAEPVRDGVVRVTIPGGFARAFADSTSTAVKVAYSYASGLSTGVAARVFAVLTTNFNAETANAVLPAKLEFVNTTTTQARPLDHLQYLLTGILVMGMMTAGMNNTCVGIVSQRERNTFKLMSCLPLTPLAYLSSIVTARMIVLFVAAFVLLIGGRYAYNIPLPLSAMQLLNAAALILVGGLTLLCMGIAMSGRIARVPTAIVVCNVVYLTLLFASDLTMPLSSYPQVVKPFLTALPTSEFVEALRAILIQGSTVVSQWKSLLSLCAWSAVCLMVSRMTFRWHSA
jgi:ABC-2 type transport system permease protein